MSEEQRIEELEARVGLLADLVRLLAEGVLPEYDSDFTPEEENKIREILENL